ncbi:glycosyltransferase family 1 protein [Cellulophaga sp. Hel_I_12]|uniref:glycosyltransferase family 1 protein n=1 Tax=Cellulophaga sp. Hel_I_12 TaxID=1249972 RepID=UPI000645789D|nr:glycosyltransferase family 1 protein [Cellulophaga sp. Hel_I_12]
MAVVRVLQVFTTMGRGGAESMIMNYYRQLDRTKVQFDFLVHRAEKAAFEEEIERLGGKIYRLHPINPLFPKSYYAELRTFFKEHAEYRIIHSHLNTFSSFPLKIAEEFKIATRIAHAHIAMDPVSLSNTFKSVGNLLEAIKKGIKLLVKKKIHRYATHYFSCGEKAGQWLFSDTTAFYVMNNAIDARSFIYDEQKAQSLRKEFQLENKIVLGHIGRFTHQKNHEYLLKIFAELNKKNEPYVLALIGDGPLQSKIKEEAKKLGISDRVHFLGLRTDIPNIVQMLDVFVFPSFYEGLPVTLIEAQAAGLQIIASDTITKEVQLTPDIQFASIAEAPEVWANKIIALGKNIKKNNFEAIVAGNYDIISNTKEIQKFYLNQINS